uniref:Ribonuclease Oy n=1 Tax=Schistosoma haematobium TaxID=6185 RepID=A0A095AZC8_SCHHA
MSICADREEQSDQRKPSHSNKSMLAYQNVLNLLVRITWFDVIIVENHSLNSLSDSISESTKRSKKAMAKFEKHEFNRHGRCATEDPAIVNQHGYFKFGIDLMKKLHLFEKLIKNGIKPDQSKQYETSDLRSVLKKEFGYNGSLKCTDIKGKVKSINFKSSEIVFYNDELILTTCYSVKNLCIDRFIHVPKTARHKDLSCKSKVPFDIKQLQVTDGINAVELFSIEQTSYYNPTHFYALLITTGWYLVTSSFSMTSELDVLN